MSTELIINASLPETRIALMENGEIQDLLIERASGKGIVGNIYKGRVTRVLPGMQAAFVDIGLEKAAFLYVDDVFVHSEIWEAEEGEPEQAGSGSETVIVTPLDRAPVEGGAPAIEGQQAQDAAASDEATGHESHDSARETIPSTAPRVDDAEAAEWESEVSEGEEGEDDEDEEEDEDEGDEPVGMCPPPGEGEGDAPEGTIKPVSQPKVIAAASGEEGAANAEGAEGVDADGRKRRHRRGRRGGRFRRRDRAEGEPGATPGPVLGADQGERAPGEPGVAASGSEDLPDSYRDQSEGSTNQSDRADFTDASHTGTQAQQGDAPGEVGQMGRPEVIVTGGAPADRPQVGTSKRPEFREQRGRDRKIRTKPAPRPVRAQANIQDLLKEGQEVIVQVAKDPISTKGARLTCHISLPGRHLVCMPTIDHVGVSRRIERDDERRKLREYVERYRPKNLGFIVRTASGRQQSEKRIKQDIEYLTRLWGEIREKAGTVTAPALVYEDLNSVLRAIRDWVTEDIDKIVVDSRYHFNDMQRFASHFMPSLKPKIELYNGDIPIFDAYNISTELARGLERKVWLKSGGYLVVDQAEALVAIDVNTGRFVGKKNLEDTILKTNLEAVQEIAYQLRLRNCGGIIILDLIDMEREENKQRVYRALEEALKKDRARPTILKISELGLVEMTRKRTRDTMVRALCEACSHCEGKGFVKSKQTMAYEVLREMERVGIERDVAKILVQAHPDVIDILAIEERDTLDQLERRYRKQVYLQAVADYHMERFEVNSDKREKGDRGIEASTDVNPRRNGRENYADRNERDRGGRNNRGRGGRDRGGRDSGGGGKDRTPQVRPVDGSTVVIDPAPFVNAHSSHPDANSDMQGSGGPQIIQPRQGGDDFYSEEDRLAFLRAQATQDAALARLGGAAAAGQVSPSRGGPVGGGGGGAGMGLGRAPVERDNDRNSRRGKRGRRGGTKQRRAPGDRPNGPAADRQAAGPRVPGVSPVAPLITPIAPASSSSGGTGGDSGAGSGGDSNPTT